MTALDSARSRTLLIWLIFVTLGAAFCGLLPLALGWLVYMDTRLAMYPRGAT